jgi:hypothetical protein
MATYKLQIGRDGVTTGSIEKTNENGQIWSIPLDPDNIDYQEYLRWLEAGNTPTPAEENQ